MRRPESRLEPWTYRTMAWEPATTRTRFRRPGGEARCHARNPPRPSRRTLGASRLDARQRAPRAPRLPASERRAAARAFEVGRPGCCRRRRRPAHVGCRHQVRSRHQHTAVAATAWKPGPKPPPGCGVCARPRERAWGLARRTFCRRSCPPFQSASRSPGTHDSQGKLDSRGSHMTCSVPGGQVGPTGSKGARDGARR